MEALFLTAYVALPLITLWRSRSITWTVLALVASVTAVGAVISFSIDHVGLWSRGSLQWALLITLALPLVVAFVWRPVQDAPRRRQLLALIVPVLALGVFFTVVLTWWTEGPAYESPVGFLMGHALAEDNAKWLDFSAAFAAGGPMEQYVPMGGQLQLFLVFVGTLMGTISTAALGGYNEVMVAANTVIYGQFLMVVIAPLALAPLVGATFRRPTAVPSKGGVRVPWPLIWLGALVLVITNLMLTAYGHLTLQFTILVCVLWVTTFLAWAPVRYALLITSMAVAVGMTVWLPMNAVAGIVVLGWLVFGAWRVIRPGRGVEDVVTLVISVLVGVAIWEPMRSSVQFVLDSSATAAGPLVSGVGGGVAAAAILAPVPAVINVLAGLTDSTLFAAGGGTEKATPVLVGLAAVAVVAAAVVVSRQRVRVQGYARFIPVLVLAGFAVMLNVLDQWATGGAPHYGSYKFTFMVTIVLIGACLPLGLLLLDPQVSGMTLSRWTAVGAVIFLLTVDSLLVRSIAAARPTQWTPPIPYDNPRSYWWPADVNGSGEQPIAGNPLGCVYLPQGAKAPSAILDSQISDPQRVYSCTRLLAGLSGEDAGAQPVVDWLRREWQTNQRAWQDVYGYLAGMPADVLDKKMILLDDGSNVIGLETMRSLLARYPADAWTR